MNVVTIAETVFCPTDEQIVFAREHAVELGFGSVLVAVNFPGKQRGIWTEGQTREAVMDGDSPVIWVDRNSALEAFETGNYGNAMFRVYRDGCAHLVDEA